MNDAKTDPKQIFLDALECGSHAELAQFLGQACLGDEGLRARVEELLRAHREAGDFLRGDATEPSPDIAESPGTQIGPYKLVEQIGEGGFGVVFLAEQERPVKRKVALKIIKPGMDTRQVIARFEAERQALALMDHPNIAKVLDAGMVGAASRAAQVEAVREEIQIPGRLAGPTGRPYFVMELVQGIPITEYCDQCTLTTRQRLELFITVCQAVQHAHQKGIIHRDLKPTNILVAIQDGEAAPKIIDFGVAKAINQRLTDHTLATGFVQMLGTPLYMSPEQAELSPLGVDTRSDIYSLGVLLYELLSGTTPFERDRLHSASYDEMRRIIREEEPPRPSARISTLAADHVTTIAEHRRTDSRRLSQQVRGELDWIVMKCLEKDRNRRYDSAGALARDIERYMHDEPVQACPPSIPYRLKKFIRRNRATAAFICLLIFGVGALTVSNIRSHRSEQRAISEGAKAKVISDLLQEMLGSADAARGKGVDYTVRELFDDFSESLGSQLADQPDAEADIHATIGRAYRSLKLPYQAQPHFEKAIEIRRRRDGPQSEKLAAVLVDGAWNLLDQQRRADAESQVNEAIAIYRSRGVMGAPLFHALEILQHILRGSAGREEDAERVTQEALAVARQSGQEFPDEANLLHRYADVKIRQGKFVEAEKLARQSVDMHYRLHGDRHPETAFGLKTLGRAQQGQRKLADAEQAFRQALQVFRHQFPDDHFNIQDTKDQLRSVLEARGDQAALEALTNEEVDEDSRSDLPSYYLHLAGLLLKDKTRGAATTDVARQLIRRATEGYGQVAVDSPDDLERRLKAVDGYVEVIKLCAADPDFAQQINNAHRMLSTELAGLLTSFTNSRCQEQVGHQYRLWAFALGQNSNYLSQFEHAHDEAIECFEEVLIAKPDSPFIWFCMANSYVHLGDVQKRLHRPEDARASFGRAIEIYNEYATEIAIEATVNAWEMTSDYFRTAGLFTNDSRSNSDQARQFVQRVIEGYDQAEMHSGDLNRRANALNGYAILVGLCAAVPGLESEVNELNRRLELELPKLLAAFPDSSDCLWNAANTYRRWAVELPWTSTHLAAVENAIRESIQLHEKLSLAEPSRPGVWLYQADRNIVLGYLLWRTAGPDDAEAPYRRAMEIFNDHAAEIEADPSAQVPLSIVIDSVWLADFLGCTDRPDEAAEMIRKAIVAAERVTDPAELALAHYAIALLQARLGDDAGYRETCRALADVPIAGADDFTKVRTILTWCHAPGALAHLSLVVQHAEEFAAHNAVDEPHIVPYVLGAALYRNGQYERAKAELEKSITAYPTVLPFWDQIINWQQLFLAMTQWQLGQRDEAQRLLAEIQPAIEKELQSPTTPMNYRITLEILRREAATLIEPNGTSEAVENRAAQATSPNGDNPTPVVPLISEP